jgi:two-component system, chemotaxis family, protein-glutamate methylesterase/glutaminase
MMVPAAANRDIVVIGASSGGVEAIATLVAGLPAELPAAVFIVLHQLPGIRSSLSELLTRRGHLRARLAIHGETIEHGRIYVAPPDNHLTIRPGHVQVMRGPKENGHRPSVDALFRTASVAYGPRVVGVVLTGNLDCGTAGLLSVKARGGMALVQDPGEAAVPEMPQSAISHVEVDRVASITELPTLIAEAVSEPAAPWPTHLPRPLGELEGAAVGPSAQIVCPVCQGKLTETELGGFRSFRCHVGHSFSLESVAAEQAEEVERALWASIRALEESASLAEKLSLSAASPDMRHRFAEKAESQRHQADLVRRILLFGGTLSRTDSEDLGLAQADPGHNA